MSTEQQYRVIGKSGPGVQWRSLPKDTMIRFVYPSAAKDPARLLGASAPMQDWWDNARYEILEAISPPQAEVATCESWCGLGLMDHRVPGPASHDFDRVIVPCLNRHGKCTARAECDHTVHCTQACLDRAEAAKPPGCIRSACKAPPVAGGELCVAHAGQVEAAKARCAWQVNGVSACGLPSTDGRLCQKHEAELRASDAAPNPPPPGTRLERWRRTHPGYSHATADQRLHDANVAAMMVGIDGPREPYVPTPKLPAWTPRDLDGDIPDAWEPGGARLGGTR